MRTVDRPLGAIHRQVPARHQRDKSLVWGRSHGAPWQDIRAHFSPHVLDTNVLWAQFWQIMAANECACHVFDTNVVSRVAKAPVGSTIARMPRRDICWTQMCFRPQERSYASFLLADRPPHVRHGLPRIASGAQAYDRRPWKIELDCSHSPADPSAGSLNRTSRICRKFPRLFPLLTYVVTGYFVVHTDPQLDPSTPSQSFRKRAGFDVQRSCVVAWRRQLGSTDSRFATGRHARVVDARRPG